jgi:hypothetical protein
MTEIEFIKHFGDNYEEAVNEHISNDKPVIRINNINGCTSSLPIDRAKYLLEKYYKMTNKPIEKEDDQVKDPKKEKATPEEVKEVKRRNSSQSPEYA